MNWQDAFEYLLQTAGAVHFVVLAAGSQVPRLLNWKTDLARLHPFNRRLLWTYWAFTGGTLAAFGTLTLSLREEMLRGDRAALALALFIGLFWLARIFVDAFYFRHSEWPAGKRFIAGHVLLNAAFTGLAATYLGLVAWHVAGR